MGNRIGKRAVRIAVLAWVSAVPISAQAEVTATPPPGGYTQPATSMQDGTSTVTTFGSGSGGTAGAGSSSGASGAGGSSSGGSSSASGLSSVLGGSTPIGPGGYVAGTCNSMGGDIANIQNLQTYQNNLAATIEEVGKVLNTGQMQQMTANEQEWNQVLQEQAMNAKILAATQAKNQYLQQTTGINLMGNNCNWSSGATDTLNGIASAQQVTAQAASDATAAEQPTVNPLDTIKTLAQATAPDISSGTILPLGGAATAVTASAISAYIKNSVVPFNAPSVPKTEKSPAATNFNAVGNVMNTQASLATVTLAAIARHNVPTINDALANHLWTESGNSGKPPGEMNGKISQDGLLQSITDGRYANPVFYQDIQMHGGTWQIKQYDIMMAAQLRMEEEEETMLEHAVALQAAMLASEESGRVNHLNTLRGNAAAQSNGALANAQ